MFYNRSKKERVNDEKDVIIVDAFNSIYGYGE
jgi:hypothetical protein